MSLSGGMVMPKISVIIPTYNHSKFICDAIDSVLMQGYQNKEIIIVDDGSTDNTGTLVRKYIRLGVKYIYKKNGGVASSRNVGIVNSTGRLISFLDSDDVWLKDKLSLQYDRLVANKETGLVGCGYYITDHDLNVIKVVKALNFRNRNVLLSNLLIKNVIYGSSSGVLLKRDCFDKVGLFDEELSCAEDWDMWLRIARFYSVEFIEEPLLKIRDNPGSMSSSNNCYKMLKYELQFIDKIFSKKPLQGKWFLKRKAYSYRYCSAAIAYKAGRKRKRVAKCCFKAFSLFPPIIFNKSAFGLGLWSILGEKWFLKLTGKKIPKQ
jgi:glycosyltransferase involved in cell wall biosynthesis